MPSSPHDLESGPRGPVYPDSGDLPATIPIFPLPGVLLLPGGELPLNIFEPRYLNMTLDALGRGRVIGMIQPLPRPDLDLQGDPEVYPIGCAGRIVRFAETPDSRLLITLLGISRFSVAEELAPERGYRRVRADYSGFAGDDAVPSPARGLDRERLIAAALRFFKARGRPVDRDSLTHAEDDLLVTSLAMASPFDTRDKQALLECADTEGRGELLTNLLEMAALMDESGGGGPGPDTAH